MEGDNKNTQPSGMKKVMSLMEEEFNTTDPLALCKKLLLYVT